MGLPSLLDNSDSKPSWYAAHCTVPAQEVLPTVVPSSSQHVSVGQGVRGGYKTYARPAGNPDNPRRPGAMGCLGGGDLGD